MHLKIITPNTLYTIKSVQTRNILYKNISWKEVLLFFEEKVYEEVSSPSQFEIKEIIWVDTIRK